MDRKILIVLVAAAVAVVAAAAILTAGDGGSTEPEPEVPTVDPLPDGFSFDPDTCTLSADRQVTWKVTDLHHACYNDDNSPYTGYTQEGGVLTFGPGEYSVEADGSTMGIQVPGKLQRTASWVYDIAGVKHSLSIVFSIDMSDFSKASERSRAFNAEAQSDGGSYLFRDLMRLVETDDTIREIESKLAAEFVRIGGSPDDRQGYADFLAGFVQLTIEYPTSIPSHRGIYDYRIWGAEEYWCVPLETLYHMAGDCEDTSALLCALYDAAGYDYAMGGHARHVFAGVHIDGYVPPGDDRIEELGAYEKPCSNRGIAYYEMGEYLNSGSLAVKGDVTYTDVVYYAVETIHDQIPVGYLGGGNQNLDRSTTWGWAGFYSKDTQVRILEG